MSFVPNSLLQANAAVKPQADPVFPAPTVVAPPKDNAFSFAQVYQNTQSNPVKVAFNPVNPMADKAPVAPAKSDVPASNAKSPDAATQSSVAGSGKSLPADKSTKADGKTASADDKGASGKAAADGTTASTDTSKPGDKTASGDDATTTTDTPVAVATPDPTADPALLQAAAAAAATPAPAAPVDPALVQAPVAATVSAATKPAAATTPAADGDFDPAADPLDNLPAVRLAMEQGGHVSSGSQTSAKSTDNTNTDATDSTLAQNQANNVVTLLDQKSDPGSSDQGGDKSFKTLIDDGLKDIKGASSDTRVDDFANRLAALTQAATPKTANALPASQPLAMHQSGWSEEVVNRVMYLSSANLKSAEIQLQPAELGRLDIKVNMSADQPTQISFISAHAGVRDALEGNMPRLRDMLQQQGLGQADVTVSDQARGWAGQGQGTQQQQQQAHKGSGSGGSLGGDSQDDLSIAAVSEAAAASTSVVVGSSAVDYYA
ncbi:flagellar hook-length control protein FliK [Pseudomonas chlororaphis]|nr:flagellar hook-length control protein FliK [Pseudomonas chlororaphis]